MKGEKCKGVIYEMLEEWRLSSNIHNHRRDDRGGLYLRYAFQKAGVRLNKHQEGEDDNKGIAEKTGSLYEALAKNREQRHRFNRVCYGED
jgi:hypothetical protein